jgi:hypothetical protein
MPTLPERVQTLLTYEYPIAAILTGGVYTRPLHRLKTPTAFSPDKIHYNPAAYIPDARYFPHRQVLSVPTAYQGFLDVVLYAEAHDGGKHKLDEVRPKIIALLDQWITDTDHGKKVFFAWSGGTGIRDSEELRGAIVSIITFSITGVWYQAE